MPHIHADYITGSGELRLSTRKVVNVAVHKASASNCAVRLLEDGDEIWLGKQVIKVIYMPGHTDTDVSDLVEGAVFTGDTDYESITRRLFSLPDETRIYRMHDL